MAQEVHRGEIWMFHYASPNKARPVLVLSANSILKAVRQATVAEVTSTMRGTPAEVSLGVEEGLKHESAVNLVNLSSVPQSLLCQYRGSVSADKMKLVCRALAAATGC